MSSILTNILRQRISRQHQCFQYFTRSYCYKPIERRIFAAKEPSNFKGARLKIYSTEDDKNGRKIGKNNTDNGRSLKIVQSLPTDPQNFTKDDLIEAFDLLSMFPASEDALVHENFIALIEATKLILPKLSTAQCVVIFNQICRARISIYDELSEYVANNLLDRVLHSVVTSKMHEELLTIDDIVDIDSAVRQYYSQERKKLSSLFDELRQSNCDLFVKKMNNLDDISYREIMRSIRYLSNNSTLVTMFDSTCLFKKLLALNDDEYEMKDVVCILVTMSRFEELNEHAKQVIEKMFRIWCNVAKSVDDVRKILMLFSFKKSEKGDFTPFQNATFIDHCTQILTRTNNVSTYFHLLEFFNELNIVSTKLIDSLSTVFDNDDHKQLKEREYIDFFTACLLTNYKPSNWKSKIVPAAMEITIDSYGIKLAYILHKMGIHHKDVPKFSKEFSMQYENESLNNSSNIRKYIVSKNNTTVTRLTADCEKFVGSNKMLCNVTVCDELTVPILLKVNTKTGDFEDMRKKSLNENLTCNMNELIVAVLTQDIGSVEDDFEIISAKLSKQRELIKERGWIGITLDESLYGSMETYKRAFTFFKVILYAINNRQKNQRNQMQSMEK